MFSVSLFSQRIEGRAIGSFHRRSRSVDETDCVAGRAREMDLQRKVGEFHLERLTAVVWSV